MDTKYWLNFHFFEGRDPNLVCSKCRSGKLFQKDKFKFLETFPSRLKFLDEYSPFTEREFKFTGFFECNNPICKEIYMVLGKVYIEPSDPDFDDMGEYLGSGCINHFLPEYISPPIEIIERKDAYPRLVNESLYDSFKLFFVDNEACANKIRIALELLLDKLGVDQIDERGKPLFLGTRIEKYNAVDQKNSKLMKATKIIGNYGSHRDKISRKDVLDGYELMEAILDDLYDNKYEKLKAKADKITSKNKPISKIQ